MLETLDGARRAGFVGLYGLGDWTVGTVDTLRVRRPEFRT